MPAGSIHMVFKALLCICCCTTSCATNPQQIKQMEFDLYASSSWWGFHNGWRSL